ncbi:MAG: DUF1533 domain-containing protein [Bacteroidetes bacterium]|nr:DUF1533 domain-containing protein [Bacteroidota bacterium]
MKKIFLLVVLGFGINILGLGQSLLVDDFTGYTIGNLGGQGSWTKGGSGPDATVANTTALTYPNYNGGGAEYVSMPSASSTTSREYKGYTTTTVSTGTFYISFLLKLSSTTATGDYFISLGDAAGGTNYYFKLYAKTSGSGYLLGISSQAAIGSAAFGATVLSLNTTYLVLLRLTGVTGSTNDLLYLWVNPTISSEPNTSSAYASKTSDADPTSLGQFIWHNRSANNPSGSFDGIRVAYGTTSANAWTNLNAYSSGGALTPPTLIAASGATVDSPFDVTFTDDPIWRAAITSITVGGTTLTVGYNTTNAGKITFTPSASSPAALLQSSGTKTIVVIATGYSNATVSQTIGVGAANKLGMKTQPTAPASNGAALATQPEVYIQDQYGNVTTNTATVVAAVGAGTWTIGGTTSKAGASGTATYTDLTATSPAAVTGATISFTSSGLTGVTSSTFNIPAPAPANDLCAGAQVIPASGPFPYLTTTVDNTNATATGDPTPSCQSFFGHSIWYTFTPSVSGGFTFSTCSSETATTISDDVMSLYSGSCGSLTPLSCNDNGGPSCTGALASINATLTSGTTYYMMVAGYSNNVGNIQIRVSCQPAVLTTTAASSVAQTSAQSG